MNFPTISRTAGAGAVVASLILSICPFAALASEPSVAISNPPAQTTILPGTSIAFTIAASGFASPTYKISDSFANSSITNSNVAVAGDIAQVSWVPSSNDIGTHSITITVSDHNASRSAHIRYTVVSTLPVGVVMFGPPSPSTTLVAGQTLTFWTIASGFPETPYESLTDSFANSTLSNGNLTDTQQFTWTPNAQDVGTHTITLTAHDRKDNIAQKSITVVVNADPHAAVATTSATATAPTPVVHATTTPSVPPVTVFTTYLKPGSENAQVLALQKMLASLGLLKAKPNGYFGVSTEKAVVAFQKAHSLTQLGVVGPGTRAALNALASHTATTTAPAENAAPSLAQQLAQLQAQLAALKGH